MTDEDSKEVKITYKGLGIDTVTETREESWIKIQLARIARAFNNLGKAGDEVGTDAVNRVKEKIENL